MRHERHLLGVACLIISLVFCSPHAHSKTVSAASCSAADVQTALSVANTGDVVEVPEGNCSWSGMTIAKAVHLKGAGIGRTNVSVGGNRITKQQNGVTRISGFTFSTAGGGNANKGLIIGGSWQSAEPVVLEGNQFLTNGSGMLRIEVDGGVIIAANDFRGGWDDSFIQPKASGSTFGWSTADTMGNRDTNGRLNIYVEDNVFYGGTNQGIDCDENSRCVYRYNDLTYSSFNSHGFATGPASVRHFEVYHNKFNHHGGTEQIAAQSWAIWIRGGTGVIFNNEIDDLAGSWWGDKPEIKLSIRGAEDARPQGSCADVKYPVPQQLGQNHNGSSYFRDPIFIWGNSGRAAISAGWSWGNPCNLNFTDFFQWGRDAIEGSAKPGYSPYAHPHPLRSATVIRPLPPAGVSVD